MRSLLVLSFDDPQARQTIRKLQRLPAMERPDALVIALNGESVETAEDDRRQAVALVRAAQESGAIIYIQPRPLLSPLIEGDLDALLPLRPVGVALPQACGGRDIQHLGAKLAVREAENGFEDGYAKIIALAAQTPAAVFALSTFHRFERRLAAIAFDADGLACALGFPAPIDPSLAPLPAPLTQARGLTVLAAASAGVPALAPAFPDATDAKGLKQACRTARADAFNGMIAITMEQAAVINAAFQ